MQRLCGAAGLAGGLVTGLGVISRADAEGRQPEHDSGTTNDSDTGADIGGKDSGQHVVIIGGGIVGASLAFHLAAGMRARGRGRGNVPNRVTILERDFVGSGASGLSAGTIWDVGAGDGTDPVADLCHRTTAMLEVVEALGHRCDWERSGGVEVATDHRQLELLRKEHARMAAKGYRLEMLEGRAAVAALLPAALPATSHVLGGIYAPLSGSVDAATATRSIAAAAIELGDGRVEVVEMAAVSRIESLGPATGQPRYAVSTASPDGTLRARVHADIVVVAAGAWCDPLGKGLGLSMPIVPVRGSIWVTEPLDTATTLNGMVCYFAEGEEFWSRVSTQDGPSQTPEHVTHNRNGIALSSSRHAYGRQNSSGALLFGGARVPTGPADYSTNDALIDASREQVCEALPGLRGKDAEIAGVWSGLMPFSMDGKALVGSLSSLGHPRVYVAGGFGGDGIMWGPGAAELLAEVILEDGDGEDASLGALGWSPTREPGGVTNVGDGA